LHDASALRGHPRVDLHLRALAATEATAADSEGRRLPVPVRPAPDRSDSKAPIADMSAVEPRENWDSRYCADQLDRSEIRLEDSAQMQFAKHDLK
jgi:hypothetical protein